MLNLIGIIALVIGAILFITSIPILLFSNRRRNQAFLLIVISILSLLAGIFCLTSTQGSNNIPSIGIIVFFFGLLLAGVGIWLSLWGPLSLRNTNKGLLFIIIGMILMILGVVFISNPTIGNSSHHSGSSPLFGSFDLQEVFAHKMGPISFGLFALLTLLLTNGAAIRNRLDIVRIIGCNLIMITLLIFIYSLGPNIFPGTW